MAIELNEIVIKKPNGEIGYAQKQYYVDSAGKPQFFWKELIGKAATFVGGGFTAIVDDQKQTATNQPVNGGNGGSYTAPIPEKKWYENPWVWIGGGFGTLLFFFLIWYAFFRKPDKPKS